uniref:Uncharacterized protein n=1 Tax=Gasterosteus aculeatus TaxID=69293 RepID=G3N7M6_GASAC
MHCGEEPAAYSDQVGLITLGSPLPGAPSLQSTKNKDVTTREVSLPQSGLKEPARGRHVSHKDFYTVFFSICACVLWKKWRRTPDRRAEEHGV